MKLRLFSLFAIIFILLIAGFVYELNLGDYKLNIWTLELNLPIAIWIVLPAFLLFLFSLLHMSFYGFLRFLRFKNYASDASRFEKYIACILLKKPAKENFKSQEFIKTAKLSKAAINKESCEDEKIDEIIKLLNDINSGKYFELRKYALAKDNELFIKNEENKLINDIKYALAYLKNKTTLNDTLDNIAFKTVLAKAQYAQIKELKIPKSKEQVLALLERLAKKDLDLSMAEIDILLAYNDLDEKSYYQASKLLVKLQDPQALIALFKKIAQKDEQAFVAWLYLLAEFGLYDDLSIAINNKDEHFKDFELVLFLHEQNKKISPHLLIDARFN